MSSNDRYTRSNRPRQSPDPAQPGFDDEVFYEDQWDVDPGAQDSDPLHDQYQPPSRNPRPTPPRSTPATPTVDGTAAQINRLRRNIRQSTRPSTQPAPVAGARRTSPPTGAARRAPVQDDHIVEDNTYVDDEAYLPEFQPQTSRSRSNPVPSQRRQSGRSAPVVTYEDDDYTANTYAEYDEFDDDFSEYDAPQRPDRQARPKPQFTMPALSRPSLPPAIARADLVNDAPALGIIGVGLASLAGMAIVVANQAESLAPEFATHVSASGILENFRPDSALWNIPLMAAMFTLMNVVMAWFISPLDRFASRFLLVGAIVVQCVAWVAIIRIL